ncbi:hypothetical protein Bca4012_027133 [Brassica carinata]
MAATPHTFLSFSSPPVSVPVRSNPGLPSSSSSSSRSRFVRECGRVSPKVKNPNLESQSDLSPTRFVTVFTIRRLYPRPFFVNRHHGFLPSAAAEKPHQIQEDRPQVPFSENRTRDILSVVAALLFGVGCGALTAATMYLVWAVVVDRHNYDFEEEDNYENEESDAASLKKLGYVKIPDPAPVKKEAA